jgi:hypothetical protein
VLWRTARRNLSVSKRWFVDLQNALAIDILLHVPLRDYWRREQLEIVSISGSAAGLPGMSDPEVRLIARQELGAVLSALVEGKQASG